jgi:hypothetical protein
MNPTQAANNVANMATAISGVNGWLVVGPGIVPGTLVSSSTGSTSFVLNQLANNTTPHATATQPATYYFVDLPSPAGTYAAPCIIFNRTNGRSYLNMNGYWVDQGDAGTFVGGIFEGGAGFFGSLDAAQIAAGTLTDIAQVTSGSGFVVNIDSSNQIKNTNTTTLDYTQVAAGEVMLSGGSGGAISGFNLQASPQNIIISDTNVSPQAQAILDVSTGVALLQLTCAPSIAGLPSCRFGSIAVANNGGTATLCINVGTAGGSGANWLAITVP